MRPWMQIILVKDEKTTLLLIRLFITVVGVVKSTLICNQFSKLWCGLETERSKSLWCFRLRSHSERNKRAASAKKAARAHGEKGQNWKASVRNTNGGILLWRAAYRARKKRQKLPRGCSSGSAAPMPDIWPVRRPPY